MRPLQSQQHTSEEKHQAFTEAVEDWLRRPRNPHADEVVLDAVQQRQERQAVISAAQLVKLQGEQPYETWLLPSDRPALVGRSADQTSSLDINLWPDMGVSRRHALIWFDGDGWFIEDLRSANGTVLDENNIQDQRAVRLTPGAKIRLGRTVLMLMELTPESGEGAQTSTDIPSVG